jgi:hypothetical protein
MLIVRLYDFISRISMERDITWSTHLLTCHCFHSHEPPFSNVSMDIHGGHTSSGSAIRASRFLIGLVTCFATHDGIPAVACAAWRR